MLSVIINQVLYRQTYHRMLFSVLFIIHILMLYISAIPDKAQHEPKIPWKIVRARLASKTIEQRKEREGRSGRGMT